MPRVFIPPLLRPLTNGVEELRVDGTTVRQVIEQLETEYPSLSTKLCQGNALAPGLSVVVDGHVRSQGLLAKVQPDSEVHFLPAIGGG